MTAEATPLSAYLTWLPGELRYVAQKHGYNTLVEDARKSADDPRSINGRLSQEWFLYQFMHKYDVRHAPAHQKTAQSQLAKFSAGLFTTAAVARWIAFGSEPGQEAFIAQADFVAEVVCHTAATSLESERYDAAAELKKPYEDTIFERGVLSIMRRIVTICDAPLTSRVLEQASVINYDALSYGKTALKCYVAYAEAELAPDQYYLAPSRLEA